MSKTFDTIWDASETEYYFLFAQRTLALKNEPPTPPPLNVLGLPCEMIRAMMELWEWRRGGQTAEGGAAEGASVTTACLQGACLRACLTAAGKPPVTTTGARTATATVLLARHGGEAFCEPREKIQEKIAPLAEKITEYIIDHQDDAAQEDRWRTIMKRDMTKSFHKVEKDMQAQREEIRKEVREEMQEQFDDVRSMLNQLVRWQTSSSSV